ncbi:cilia- and flagella-associated protein 44 isoform X2 [Venturia canescens]|uniref:cilia- and flagella-associated protein 44 isoform X2 n=1 Tax=Venturia canescens TaxID=32260 RepID=UPI001C9D0AEC|nr:cilia- and flagella-associated protein 44 isoform X2 [Venturia canescens]
MESIDDGYRWSKPDYEKWFDEEEDSQNKDPESSQIFNTEDYISGAIRAENGTVAHNILELDHSYGYDCQRFFNLCVADSDTVIFASGNLIHFFNTVTGDVTFRRCSTGGGIGHITKNPSIDHIAVGENGTDPPIIIYEWPSMKIVRILRGGTTRSYCHLAYSRDGRLLVSQGGDPDSMITVWNWKKSKILLHCKSHGQEIFKAMFSPTVPGNLTTCGAGHVKFWKMARTFTGLKLQGELGRFGKTEISDVIAVYPMPDEKVVSGCEWGNILIWEEDLIKLEVCKKSRNSCHGKYQISQFEYLNGDLVSIGMDGWIRVWYYETIDQADPPDEDRFLENEPIYEFQIKEGGQTEEDTSMLLSMMKKNPDDSDENLWYAQDGNGGLWLLELGIYEQPKRDPQKLFTCHAGPISWMDVSTWGPYVATCGRDGHLHIYNYARRKLILVKKFRDKGISRLVWFPCSIESTGSTIACAFESGVIRLVALAILHADRSDDINTDYSRLIQAIRPHKSTITAISLNRNNSLLVSGSEDSTIFIFSINVTETYPELVPVGYVKLASGVSCIAWKPEQESETVFIGCQRGDCAEIKLPEKPENNRKRVTYELTHCEATYFKFQSVKSKIRRELARLEMEKRKAKKRLAKQERMEEFRRENPGIAIDEEEFLADIEEDPPLPEIYIPEIPNRVLTANYRGVGTIWLTMGGYDAGYIYEYEIPPSSKSLVPTFPDEVQPAIEPVKSSIVTNADDTEIASCFFYGNKYLFLGMGGGEIRICRINSHDDMDFSDYLVLPMHEPKNGLIPVISLSYDGKMLLTCGHDGNLFSYKINDECTNWPPRRIEQAKEQAAELPAPTSKVRDIEESAQQLILEEVIVKSEHDRIFAAAKRKKDASLALLGNLSEEYRTILERNSRILKSQQIPQEEFELDPRITADLNDRLKREMDLVHKKMAFEVEKSRLGLHKMMEHFVESLVQLPFAVSRISKPRTVVHSLRERKLGSDFASIYSEVVKRIEEKNEAVRSSERASERYAAEGNRDKMFDTKIDKTDVAEQQEEEEKKNFGGVENLLMGLDPDTVLDRLAIQANQLLRKYREREEKMKARKREWKAMYASRPDPDSNHPEDVAAIERAKNTIGDYKLKAFPNFSQAQEKRETTLTKYKELLDCRKKTHHIRQNFNSRLNAIRDEKLALRSQVFASIRKLKEIHAEIPNKKIKPLPIIPEIDDNIEFPEKNLELEKYVTMAERVKATKRKRMSISEEIIINPMEEEYEVLLLDEKMIALELNASIKNLEVMKPEKLSKARVSVPRELLKSLEANDQRETPWEHEMKRLRASRKVHEQDSILRGIEKSYASLDHRLDELERERLEITAESVYSDLFLLTLHQELIVLQDFESMEDILTEKVARKMEERDAINLQVQATTIRIDQRYKEITKLHDNIKHLEMKFDRMVSDNKFADFLKRIYKKKFKPPKDVDDDSSSPSSSDSSSSEDDGKSLASDDLGPLRLNENICPIGCDQELYDSAFSMRDERYECEHKIRDAQKIIETLRKEVDGETKKWKQIDGELKTNRKDLDDFMCEKQKKLNDIDMTVILKFHQLQHLAGDNRVARIRDCVVFDKTKLSRLYTRVGELQQETLDQKEKHKKNRTHLHRMKIDCKHMEGEIKKLKSRIKQEMMEKFGREISIDYLYEVVLKRMIHDVRADVREMTRDFDIKIQAVKEKYYQQLSILENLVRDNTEKLSFITVLEGERMKLKKILRHKPESEEKILKMELEYKEDLDRLEGIMRNQRNQRKLFQNDIRNLRLKTRPLPTICARKSVNLLRNVDKSNDEMNVISLDPDSRSENEFLTEATCDETDISEKNEDRVEDEKQLEKKLNEEKEDSRTIASAAAMVHRLMSRVLESSAQEEEEQGSEGADREIFKQVLESVPTEGGIVEMREGIERSVDRILGSLPDGNEEAVEAMREAVKESLDEIVERFEEESRGVGTSLSEIGWNMKQKITDLLESMGIKGDAGIENDLIKHLKNDDEIEDAIEYLLKNVQTVSDAETLAVLKEHAFRTLTEIKEEMTESEKTEDPTSRVRTRKS